MGLLDRVLGRDIKKMEAAHERQLVAMSEQQAFLTKTLDETRAKAEALKRPNLGNLITKSMLHDYRSPVVLQQLYMELYKNSTFRHCVNVITDGLTKEGLETLPKWENKCTMCGREFEYSEDVCKCGSTQFIEPDEGEKEIFTEWYDDMNINHQTLETMTHQWAEDLEVADDAYIIYIYDYIPIGDKLIPSLREILRGDPTVMEPIYNENGLLGEGPNQMWFCPVHRENAVPNEPSNPLCTECKKLQIITPLVKAHYRARNDTVYQQINATNPTRPGYIYYAEWEVFLSSKYSPSLVGGFPSAITLWKEFQLLDYMLEYMLYFYIEGKYPRGVLAIVGDNPDDIYEKASNWQEQHRSDPFFTPVVAVSSQTGRGKVEWIPLADSVKEMEWRDVREEINNRIAAYYRLTKSYMNDPTSGSGLGNTSLDMSLTQEGMDMGQNIFDNVIFPELNKHIAIVAGDKELAERWKTQLKKNRISQKVRNIELDLKAAEFAQAMANMGYEHQWDPEKHEFTFSDKPTQNDMSAFMGPPPSGSEEEIGGGDFEEQPQEAPEEAGV